MTTRAPLPTPPATVRPKRRPRPVPTVHRLASVALSPYLYAAAALLLFFGTIQVAQGVGFWTTGARVTAAVERPAGAPDPNAVRGRMTIQNVCDVYGVAPAAFYARFNVPAGTSPEMQLRELEEVAPGFSVDAVRLWLAEQPVR